MSQSINTELSDNIKKLLHETESIFPNSLMKNIRTAFADCNGVYSVFGCELIAKIDNVKSALHALADLVESEQPMHLVGLYCRSAMAANSELIRLLKTQEYSEVILEVIKAGNLSEDIIEDLWRAYYEQ